MMKTLKYNKEEIFWNLINSGLAGALVFLGSLANGQITYQGIIGAVVAGLIVMATKFKDYWAREQGEYTKNLFTFI